MISIDEFSNEFFQDIQSEADASGRFVEDAFFEKSCACLIDEGEFDTVERAYYKNNSGSLRTDGYGGDPNESSGTLNLIISDFNSSSEIKSLNRTELESIISKPLRFVRQALKPVWRNALEETSPGFGLADLVARRWGKINRIRIILISNRELRLRVDGVESEQLDGCPVTYSVWDIGRLYRSLATGHGQEKIEIDLEQDFGNALPLLSAHLQGAEYEAYLAVIPGKVLGEIYDKWGARLLEQNVRVYLQARGNVNKGIKITLENDPSMFLAYNNGITATAEKIETEDKDGQLFLKYLNNFQIVNGGQTTASIHSSFRNGDDLSGVFVQMKLSIVNPEKIDEIVPKISRYANTQNRVNAADFFANHPFHVRMESFSRRLRAPSPDGTFRETKWFYERARGQYANARSFLTSAQRKKFDIEHPRSQLFSKTDLAKYMNVWLDCPHIVSLGAQKNFVHFAENIGKLWNENKDNFNEELFREIVAKAIFFKSTEKIVTNQPWYKGGYRANIVAYAIAKMAHDVNEMKRAVDFSAIWKNQSLGDVLENSLIHVSEAVHDILLDPLPSKSNITEWAKKQACWARVESLNIDWPDNFINELVTEEESKSKNKNAKKEQKMLNGIEAQTTVVNAGAEFWKNTLAWGLEKNVISPHEKSVLSICGNIPSKLPNEKQSANAISILEKLQSEGYDGVVE